MRRLGLLTWWIVAAAACSGDGRGATSSNTLQVTATVRSDPANGPTAISLTVYVNDSAGSPIYDAFVRMGPQGAPVTLPLDGMGDGNYSFEFYTGMVPFWELSVTHGPDYLAGVVMEAPPDATLAITPTSPVVNSEATLSWAPVDTVGVYSHVRVVHVPWVYNATYEDSVDQEATGTRLLPPATFSTSGNYVATVTRSRPVTLPGPQSTGDVIEFQSIDFTVP